MRPPFNYCWRIFSRCFTVKKLISSTRSTQLARHVSSLLSSLPPRIVPVMHFFQHTSVSACVSTPSSASFKHCHNVRGPPTRTKTQLALDVEGKGKHDVLAWTSDLLDSSARNCRSSPLSLSFSLLRSASSMAWRVVSIA